jgi:FlaA1/EpsC-like NDP-sugar epimerase
MRSPLNRHRLWQVAVDAGLIVAAWVLAWYLRFEGARRPVYYDRYLEWDVIALVLGVKLPVFVAFGFYNRWWRYVSTQDVWGAVRGVAAASVAAFLTFTLLDFHPASVPRGIWIVDLLLLLALVTGSRLLARTLIERPSAGTIVARGKEVVIVGAGDAAQLILREMLRNPALGYTPIGLIDDDPRKKNLRLHGVRVLGTTSELRHLLRDRRPDELLIAIPSASGETRERIVEIARAERVPVKTLPGLPELIAGDYNLAGQIRPVEVEDLLGREPVETDLDSIAGYLTGEVVLVTGAGGSIGSELCRQIARVGPTRLVLVDNGEPALFEIERELVDERGFHATAAILADAGNAAKVRQVFEKYRPAVVFHAAAYKHVPLLEANPLEAVRNNTLATRTIADLAVEFGAKRFVLVSTDKAVNPKTLMGQSKALCEWIVEAWGHRADTPTRFCGVRFGNVLGSSGSVIPIFRKQIARGGPVTVTHPEMTRYFMTIPEAVQLVIQAGAIGGRGQVYVLDMGEPVKIIDLADTMIRLSGKEPMTDVKVEFIGARPGEKLHEELWSKDETVTPSSHEAILLVTRSPIDAAWLEEELDRLAQLVATGDTLELVGRLNALVGAPRRATATVSGDGAGAVETAPASVSVEAPGYEPGARSSSS